MTLYSPAVETEMLEVFSWNLFPLRYHLWPLPPSEEMVADEFLQT
ncbi:hypothetical protein AQAU111925_09305 [Aquirufa aurantiipilula]